MKTTQDRDVIPLHIAIVEDDLDTRLAMTELLCFLQHYVIAFPSAEAVWMHPDFEKIDLFLLDIGLPGLNGNALCRSLRSVCFHRKTVVVAVSGTKDGETQALSAGFDAFIAKPIGITQLRRILESVSNRRTKSNQNRDTI